MTRRQFEMMTPREIVEMVILECRNCLPLLENVEHAGPHRDIQLGSFTITPRFQDQDLGTWVEDGSAHLWYPDAITGEPVDHRPESLLRWNGQFNPVAPQVENRPAPVPEPVQSRGTDQWAFAP